MMSVRSRGGWLRRVIAPGATFVALGAVLVAPLSASAAPVEGFAAATLSTSSTCGPPSVTQTFWGSGVEELASGDQLMLTAVRSDGTPAGTAASKAITRKADGSFIDSLAFDAGDAPAVKVILWIDTFEGPVVKFAPSALALAVPDFPRQQASLWYLSRCPRIQPTPAELQEAPGEVTVSLAVSGFRAGIPVQLSLPGRVLTPSTVTPTSNDGVTTVSVVIDSQPPCGATALVAFQATADDSGMPNRQHQTSVRVWCPKLTLSPDSVSDVELPETVTVAGADWMPFGEVTLTFDGRPIGTPTNAGEDGAFSIPVSIPQSDCVPHTIVATQDEPIIIDFAPSAGPSAAFIPQLRKQATFVVTCAAGDIEATPALLVETPGPQVIVVALHNFRRGVPVTLSQPGVTLTPSTITPDFEGPDPRVAVTLNQQPACGANTLSASQPQSDDALPNKEASTTVYVLCPRLTATPDTVTDVNLPDPVTLGGNGWVPNVPATLLYDDKAIGEATPGPNGELTTTATIPRSECGPHKLEAVQVVDSKTPIDPPLPRASGRLELRGLSVINVSCSTPFVSALPQVLAEKSGPQKLDVKISGFLQGIGVKLSLPGVVLNPDTVEPTRENPGEATVTLNHQPKCGESTLAAAQVGSGEFPVNRTASTSVFVFCPRLTATPGSLPDTALPGKVTTSGTGWVPNQKIQLLMDGKVVATITPGDNGNLADSPKLPRSACGKHQLEAVQVTAADADPDSTHLPPLLADFVLRAKATVTVVCTPAFLAVNPGVVVDGNATEAAGVGFTPGRAVMLEWAYEDGARLGDACEATVSAGGTFIVNCLVLPNTALGTRLLRAIEIVPPGDPVAARKGEAPLLVVPGSMDRGHTSGRFLERR